MFTAICKKNCTWHGKYWEEGEEYRGRAEPPHHFEITARPVEAKPEPPKEPSKPDKKNEGDK